MKSAFDDGLVSLTFAAKDSGENLEVQVKRVSAEPLSLKIDRGETTFEFGKQSVTIVTDSAIELDLSKQEERSFTVRQRGNVKVTTGAITWTKLPKIAGTIEKQLVLLGTVRSQDGSPVAGETVYFAPVKDGKISTVFKVEGGGTTGIENPSAQTDKVGRFRIAVGFAFLEKAQEFEIGILDCPRCFTPPRRRLRKSSGSISETFSIDSIERLMSAKELDLSEFVLTPGPPNLF